MKILIITNLYPLPWEPNRATFNKQQFDRLAEQHELDIMVPVAWRDYFANRSKLKSVQHEKGHIKYVCYWYTPKVLQAFYGLFMSLSIWAAARKWLKRGGYDCVLGSWAHPDGYAASQIAKKLRKPYLIKVHGSDINVLTKEKARKQQITEVCLGAAHIFAPSDALRNKLVAMGVPADKVTRNYNGVDTALFFPEDIRQPYFLFVGNLKQDKGVLDLLEAYAAYKHAGGAFALKYIGAGPMHGKLKERIAQLGLQDSVSLLGAMKHDAVAPLLRCSSTLVLPSYHEGVPNVLLEAANCAVPVVSTKVGGIPEVVTEGVTGLLIEAGDVGALEQALLSAERTNDWDHSVILEQGKRFTWDENIHCFNRVLLSI